MMSSDEVCRKEGSKFRWEGEVNILKRWAESVIVGKAFRNNGSVEYFTVWVDTGSARLSSSVEVQFIRDFELKTQSDTASSGGEVAAALLSYWGKIVDPSNVVRAARWMKAKGVDPHHFWRAGVARIFMASQLPLLEETGEQPAIEDLISQWEKEEKF